MNWEDDSIFNELKEKTKIENAKEKVKVKSETFEAKVEDDWNDDSIFTNNEVKIKLDNSKKEDKSEAKVDDDWEEELPFFDELRKDFDEELSHVEYKRLEPPPKDLELNEENKHLFGFTGRKPIRGKADLVVDDSVVVPHNKYLLLKYDCHINVECTIGQTGSPKYTCKYVTKMGDVVCAKLQKVKLNKDGEEVIDFNEGERHLIARIMTGCEAWMRASNCWIIKQSHIVECLQVHLEGGNTKVFQPGYEAEAADKDDKSQLIAFFALYIQMVLG
uniref:Uncharacterized protein n=1 Tax=Panagrolaimus superbus TaxID=310955 RepID=A0A914Y9F3_9BILA